MSEEMKKNEALEKEDGVQVEVSGTVSAINTAWNEQYNNITVTILDFENAVAMSQTAEKMNKTAKIHIPVDTGMSRIGFAPDEIGAEEVLKIASLKNICIEGVFTHFATAVEKNKEFR